MKKITWCFFAIFLAISVHGQWTTSGSNIYNTNTGLVGIGTSTPGTQLEVNTNSIADGLQLCYTGAAGFVRLTASNFVTGYLNPIAANGDAALIFAGNGLDSIRTGFVIAPYKSTLSGLRVDKDGNVGIYTNDTKGYQLAVNGSAVFTAVWVKPYANWPDYVFDKGYHLPSLDSLSTFIQRHRHLPGIPSAESVEAKGVDIGSTQSAMLKKIEELTLYIIDQKKEIDALKQKNTELQVKTERIDRLEQLVEQLAKRVSGTSLNQQP